MKLFKSGKKQQQDPLAPSSPAKGAEATSRQSNPGLVIAIGGWLLATAVVAYSLYDNGQQQRQQLSQAWSSSQAGALQQSLKQLAADTQTAAQSPALVAALQSQDPGQIQSTEATLSYWQGIVDAHLTARGKGALQADRRAPLNYAALDMINRVEKGKDAAVEAYKIGDQWVVYSAAAVRKDSNSPVLGTLLLAFDLKRVMAGVPELPAGIGQIVLTQKFASAPAQTLSQRGNGGQASETLSSGNQNWQLSFSAGPELQPTWPSWPLLGLAALIALGGLLLGFKLASRGLKQQLSEDVDQLRQLIGELSVGKSVKSFSLNLPELGHLAQLLASMPRRSNEPPAKPAAKPAGPEPPLFQDTDILDIDILDNDQDPLELEQAPVMTTEITAPKLPADIFRAYDIRGVVGRTLTPETAYWVGRAVGSESLAKGEPNVAVGRDGRLSGPELVEQLIQGLVDCGCNVSDVGMVPTPVVYYAANILSGKSAVMLTGSHNPPDYNGFKIVVAGDTLANEQIQALKTRIDNNDLASGNGSVEQVDVLERYFAEIRDDIALAKNLRVVVDCGNGAAGVIAPQLIEALGCEVIPLFCDVDGNFPNHHPDPGKPENLVDLIAAVKEHNADLGLAFDGDGDRVGVVTNKGTIVYPDRLLMLFAKDVVSRNPGADIIFDVKCTRRLIPLISGYGGRPVMWKTGHSLIKKKMKETGALLAGEMSGHIFFKERWFGFDDGIYSAARLLEILSQEDKDAESIFNAFPSDISTPEINIEVTDANKFQLIQSLQDDGSWGEAKITTLDGVRVDYPKGWGLVRASNTTPVLVLRFEAETEEELERIKTVFRTQLNSLAPDIDVPF